MEKEQGGIQLIIKTEEVEMETQNTRRPSSRHANAPCDPQSDQSSVGDTQTKK